MKKIQSKPLNTTVNSDMSGHNISTRVRDGRAKSAAGSIEGFAVFGQRLLSGLISGSTDGSIAVGEKSLIKAVIVLQGCIAARLLQYGRKGRIRFGLRLSGVPQVLCGLLGPSAGSNAIPGQVVILESGLHRCQSVHDRLNPPEAIPINAHKYWWSHAVERLHVASKVSLVVEQRLVRVL